MEQAKNIYSFKVKTIDGIEKSLLDYRGKTLLIVNVASKCGFTPQYRQLEELFQKYKNRNFMVLGFPANNFLWQEPGTDADIKKFCSINYNVSFDMFSKISVRGKDQHPLYCYLTKESAFKGAVKWNFQKYVVDKEGNVVAKYFPQTKPDDLELIKTIEKYL